MRVGRGRERKKEKEKERKRERERERDGESKVDETKHRRTRWGDDANPGLKSRASRDQVEAAELDGRALSRQEQSVETSSVS